MNPALPESTTTESERHEQEPQERDVTITVGGAENGRIPISILAVPTAALDASGGLFVDLRLGKKAPSDMPLVFGDSSAHPSSIESGDAAVAELARIETATERAASGHEVEEALSERDEAASAESPIRPPKIRKVTEGKYPIVSHQVGKALKLIVGQSESFRAELAAPPAPADGEHWYARARFATNEGRDLRSSGTLI